LRFLESFRSSGILPNSSAVRGFCYNRNLVNYESKASELDAMPQCAAAVFLGIPQNAP